ncbi:DUF1289 domain-containing protein [Zobellella maritima]|uniref:DUF1289 domain-containing protein n=1 Tax=Zobellella maritima TaxID=2059725 RepID=UPI000E308880|nr:DUF1289 domain-containing protein [Zobellella maritima]
MSEVRSPCTKKCTLDENEICLGCRRSIGEIMQWSRADNEQKRQILARVAARRTREASTTSGAGRGGDSG